MQVPVNLVKVEADGRDDSLIPVLKPAESARVITVVNDEERLRNLKKYHSSQPSSPRRKESYPGLQEVKRESEEVDLSQAKVPRGPKVTQDNSHATNSVSATMKKALTNRHTNGSEIKLPVKSITEMLDKIPVYNAATKPAKKIAASNSSVSSLQKMKPVVDYMAPKEAHTINEVKNNTKITFEVPIKKPKHTRNGRQD